MTLKSIKNALLPSPRLTKMRLPGVSRPKWSTVIALVPTALSTAPAVGSPGYLQPELRYGNSISDQYYFCKEPADCGNHYAAELLRQLQSQGGLYVVVGVEIFGATPSNPDTLNGKPAYYTFTKRITTRSPSGELSSVSYQDGYSVSVIPWCPNGTHVAVSKAGPPNQVVECKPLFFKPAANSCPIVGRPVFGENGEKWQKEVDYQPTEPLLGIVRNWYGANGRFSFPINSKLAGLPAQSDIGCHPGVWTSEPDIQGNRLNMPACFRYLVKPNELVQISSTGQSVVVQGSSGGTQFASTGAGPKRVLVLNANGSATVRTEDNFLESYDSSGLLTSRTAANGALAEYIRLLTPTEI